MDLHIFKTQVFPIREKLYRSALKMLKDGSDAEDAVQEVMLKLWMVRERLPEYRSVEALAMQINKNTCLNKIRARKLYVDNAFEYILSEENSPEKQLELTDSVDTVSKIINQLPDMQRMIIKLRDIEGYQPEEIAEVLGCEVASVRVNLSRARKKVREMFFSINNFEN